MTTVRDLTADGRARLAARLIDELGMDAVSRWLDGITVLPPAPGVAMLACRCGAVLDAADMHRRRGRHPGGPPIARITCCDCSGDGGRRA